MTKCNLRVFSKIRYYTILSLYFIFSMYIFARFASSFLYFWLAGIWLFDIARRRLIVNILLNELVDLIMRDINGNIVGSTIFVAKNITEIFSSLILIQYESNRLFVKRYFWISASVYYMVSFFCKTLNIDLTIIIFDFSIHTSRFLKNLQSFCILLLYTSLKSSSIYPLKSSWNNFQKLSSLQLYLSHIVIALTMSLTIDSRVFFIYSVLLF